MTDEDRLEPESLQRLRQTGLDWCLYAAAGLKTLSTTTVAIELFPWEGRGVLMSFYLLNLVFVYVLAFVRPLGFVVRGTGLALYVYTLGVAELWNYGIASVGTLYFVTAVLFAVLLFGSRHGAVWLGITASTYVACAVAYSMGLPDVRTPQQTVSIPILNWASPGIIYLYCATATLILSALFLQRLQLEIRQGEATVAVLAGEVAERTRAEAELRTSREELRHLATSLDQAREHERAEVARWIHDELGQTLTAIALDAGWLRDAATREEQCEERWNALEAMVKDAHRSVGRLATELRPSILDDLGLPAAIEAHLDEFSQRTEIGVTASGLEELQGLTGEAATAVFRIVQESLTNVAKHADADTVRVEVQHEHGSVVLTVEDDGGGLTQSRHGSGTGLGILGMKERAAAHGGEVSVRRRAEGGTVVMLELPVLSPSRLRQEHPLPAGRST